MSELKTVIEGIGTAFEEFKSANDKRLKEIEAKGFADPLLTEQVNKIAEQITHLDGLKARLDQAETKLNRQGLGGGNKPAAEELKAARDFHRVQLAVRGQYKAGVQIRDEQIDLDGYKAWSEAFPLYLRRDERALEAKALSVGSDPDGGYLVPTAMSSRILTKVYESSPIRQLATVEVIGTDALELPVDEGEFDFGWVGETESRTETGTSTVGVQRIPVHEQYAKPKATQKLLEDASMDIENWLSGKVAEKFGRSEATGFVNGTGVKQPRGFLTYASGTSRGQIEQIVSGSAAAITADGLIKLVYALKEAYTNGASFLMRRTTVRDVMLLKDGNNQYLWRPGLSEGQPSTLLGFPVREAADMPAIAANALAIAFGNFRMGYTVVDRLGITTLRDPYSAKPFVEFYSRRRVGGDVTTFEAIKIQKIAS